MSRAEKVVVPVAGVGRHAQVCGQTNARYREEAPVRRVEAPLLRLFPQEEEQEDRNDRDDPRVRTALLLLAPILLAAMPVPERDRRDSRNSRSNRVIPTIPL